MFYLNCYRLPALRAGRIWALALLAGLAPSSLSVSAHAQSSGGLSPTQREEVRSIIADELLTNPELLARAINVLQQRRQDLLQASKSTAAKNVLTSLAKRSDVPKIGSKSTKKVVIEFFDYNCPYCRRSAAVLDEIRRKDPSVAVWYVEYPILSDTSKLGARAALAARFQGKYLTMHQALMSRGGTLTEDSVLAAAHSAGVDIQQMLRDMKRPEVKDALDKNAVLAQATNITGVAELGHR